jgi:hypothetical protein
MILKKKIYSLIAGLLITATVIGQPGTDSLSTFRNKPFDSAYSRFSVGWGIVSTKNWMTGNLGDKFSSSPLLGISLEMNVNHVKVLTSGYTTRGNTNHDFIYNDTIWAKNTRLSGWTWDFAINYIFFENRKFAISLGAGITWQIISPNNLDKIPAYEKMSFNAKGSPLINMTFDFTPFNNEKKSLRDKVAVGFYGLRIRPVYYFTALGRKKEIFKGNVFSLQLSLIALTKKLR